MIGLALIVVAVFSDALAIRWANRDEYLLAFVYATLGAIAGFEAVCELMLTQP